MLQFISGRLISFRNLLIYVNNRQYTIVDISESSHYSSHSNNVRSASNILYLCFPANNSTDVHHCDIVSSRSSPSHFTYK
jgi:hypothetical protein